MAPGKGNSSKGTLPSKAEENKYSKKYGELKLKVQQVEEENVKLQIKILKSKKNISRLRIQRAILYDRLETTATATNPFSLTSAHLEKDSTLALPAPPTILDNVTYPLLNPSATLVPIAVHVGSNRNELSEINSSNTPNEPIASSSRLAEGMELMVDPVTKVEESEMVWY